MKTMPRLKGFNYRRPFFYMVTLKRRANLPAFSQIAGAADPPKDAKGRPMYLIANEITRAFAREIREFAGKWRGIAPIECFIVMPDHIHLLIKIEETGDQLPLGSYVHQIMRALAREYWAICGATGRPAQYSDGEGASCREATGRSAQYSDGEGASCCEATGRSAQYSDGGGASCREATGRSAQYSDGGGAPQDQSVVLPASSGNIKKLAPVFERDWHEWIVKKDGQLAAFTRYIRENPYRAWLRRQNGRFFGEVRKVAFLGREWFAYGNTAILNLPVLKAVKGHRTTKQGSAEWEAMVEDCARIGPGGAGVGTFMSPLEKACGNAIAASGGRWVVLSPEGFSPRWHPPREKERFCAEGRMLFLSLYEVMDRLPTKQELYRRCHEMGDIAVAGLGECGGMAPAAQHAY